MIDAVLHEQKIVDDSATVSNIDVSFTSSNAMGGDRAGVDAVENVLESSPSGKVCIKSENVFLTQLQTLSVLSDQLIRRVGKD